MLTLIWIEISIWRRKLEVPNLPSGSGSRSALSCYSRKGISKLGVLPAWKKLPRAIKVPLYISKQEHREVYMFLG